MFTHDGVHSAVTHIHLNLRRQNPVHHETQTKAPFIPTVRHQGFPPKRRSHSSILPSNIRHRMTAGVGPTSASAVGGHSGWRAWTIMKDPVLFLLHITWAHVRRSGLYHSFKDSGKRGHLQSSGRETADWLGFCSKRGIRQCVDAIKSGKTEA